MNITSIERNAADERPNAFILESNYPNPFNPSTILRYRVPESAHIELAVFNIQGKRIRTLVQSYQREGVYEIKWNGSDDNGIVASGIYIARLYAQRGTDFKIQTQRMVLLK